MTRLEALAEAIQWYEGWYPFSHSWRYNNPGNLRWSKFQERNLHSFAYFNSYAMGWLALWWDLYSKCTGNTSTSLTPASTLEELFAVWAPKSDGNDPLRYAQKVANRLNISMLTSLSWFTQDI